MYERLKSHEVAKFDSFLKEMDRDIRDILTRTDPTTTRKLNAQLKLIDKSLNGTFKEYQKVWNDSTKSLSVYEADFEHRSLGTVIEGVSFTLPSEAQITAAVFTAPLGNIGGKYSGALIEDMYKGFSADETQRIKGVIRSGYVEGLTTGQVLKRVRGTKAASFRDGALAQTKRAQETITRTALQHASSQARNDVWDANKEVINKVKWSSTLDSRTSQTCASLDGQEFPLDKGPRPPIHMRCRSTTVAVLRKGLEFLQEGGTRSTRSPATGKVGKTSADQTYYGWLKKQPASVQNSIIGPTRGKLLRNGGLTSERFAELNVGKDFKPVTLDQMREMDAVAFEKAGL